MDVLVYYQYIFGEYQGFELYNNVGVMVLLVVLALILKNEMFYVLFIELDLKSWFG